MLPDAPPALAEPSVHAHIANGSIAARVDELEALLHSPSIALSQIADWTDSLLAMLLGVRADPIEELFERWISFSKSWHVVGGMIVVGADGSRVESLDVAQHSQYGCERVEMVVEAPLAADWLSGSAGCLWPNRHTARYPLFAMTGMTWPGALVLFVAWSVRATLI